MFSKKRGFTLVEIMIVVAIIALLAAIAIPNLLRSRLNAAEANAQATLRTLSSAFESYAAREGDYEITVEALAGLGEDAQDPRYISENYIDTDRNPIQGYTIACPVEDDSGGYHCTASPAGAFEGRGRFFAVCTGGLLEEDDDELPDCPTAPSAG